ncbi:hypothetical protein [Subtercola boreus]|uniref:hypothetical protein n=1 Tax=Subtercola boreus TaxID=120213 RepID=UPI001558AA9B|nr:hypothetical protein [Subtercola boreus]
MDLGPYTGYPLPLAIREAYGADTAGELADRLGVTTRPGSDVGPAADAAYQSLRRGDQAPARALLIEKLGLSESAADEALAKLPKL